MTVVPLNPGRINPLATVRMPSTHFSERVSGIRLITIHCTASGDHAHGDADLRAIGEWFQNPASGVSAHRCVNLNGHTAVYVNDHAKAWHCMSYNSASLGLEQIGQTWTHWGDDHHRKLIEEAARNVAQWSYRYHIPLRRGRVAFGRVLLSGIVTHKQLGSAGGNHDNPGPEYPMGTLIELARFFKTKIKESHAQGVKLAAMPDEIHHEKTCIALPHDHDLSIVEGGS